MALFSDLANAALAKSLPAVDKWLRARLGSETHIASATVEGSRVVLSRVRLPLGPRIRLEIDRATIAVVAKTLKSPHLYVVSAAGRIVVGGGGHELTARIELAEGHDRADTWLAGSVAVDDAGGDGEDRLAGELDVELSTTRWRIRGELSDKKSKHRVEADGPLGPRAEAPVSHLRVDVRDAPIGMILEHAAAWLDVEPPPLAIAEGARATGELRFRGGKLSSKTTWRDVAVGAVALSTPLEVEAELVIVPEARMAHGEVSLGTARSTVEVTAIRHARGKLESARLEGEIAFADVLETGVLAGPWRPTARGGARVSLVLGDGPRLTGEASAERVELDTPNRLGAPPLAFTEVRCDLELDRERLTLTSLSAEGYGTRFEGQAEHAFGGAAERPLAVIGFVDANVELVRALASLGDAIRLDVAQDAVRPLGTRWVAPDLRLSGRVSVEATREIRGELALETRESALIIPLTVAAAASFGEALLDGTQIRGRLATRDAVGLGMFDGPIMPRPEGSFNVSARVLGPVGKPRVEARIDSPACRVNLWGLIDLPLSEVAAEVLLDQEAIVWKEGRAKLFSGEATAEGVLGFTDAFRGIDSVMSCDGVVIGELALPSGPVSAHVDGLLRGRLHVRRLDGGAITGEAAAHLSEPTYPMVRHAHRQLADVGLPPPPPHGTTPLTCTLTLTDAHATVSDLEAAIEGTAVRGAGRVGYDGSLHGEATARLRGAYLKKSPLFVIPASISGGITVPVHVRGTLAQPTLSADVAAALRDKLGTAEISSALSGAFDGLRVAADGAVGALDSLLSGIGAKAAPAAHDHQLEAVVERCMTGDPHTEELIDRLIDAGVTSDDIVRILERRRMRF